MGLSVVGFSVPVFVIGYVLIQILRSTCAGLPVQGYRSIYNGFGGPTSSDSSCRPARCRSSTSR